VGREPPGRRGAAWRGVAQDSAGHSALRQPTPSKQFGKIVVFLEKPLNHGFWVPRRSDKLFWSMGVKYGGANYRASHNTMPSTRAIPLKVSLNAQQTVQKPTK